MVREVLVSVTIGKPLLSRRMTCQHFHELLSCVQMGGKQYALHVNSAGQQILTPLEMSPNQQIVGIPAASAASNPGASQQQLVRIINPPGQPPPNQ